MESNGEVLASKQDVFENYRDFLKQNNPAFTSGLSMLE